MIGKLKPFFTLTAVIFVASILFFNAGFDSKSFSNNTTPNPMLLDTFSLQANPGPANNGGSPGWAMFLDLIAGPNDITVTQMSTASTAGASATFSVEIFTRTGTALGGPVGSGPGSSSAGWTSIGTATFTQGTTGNGISLVCTIPSITVTAGDTVGVALQFSGVGPRYYGTGTPPLSVYSDTNITLITGDGRSAPFTPTGSFFSSRALTGEIRYVVNIVSVVGNNGSETPDGFKLSQNYPNPFNPSTTIEFSVPQKSRVVLKIYNAQGQEVTTLTNKDYLPGNYSILWNASGLSSGVYFYSIRAGNFLQTKKMLLVK